MTRLTLETAADNIGREVIYSPRPGVEDRGTIVRISGEYVMVNYGRKGIMATYPEDLVLELATFEDTPFPERDAAEVARLRKLAEEAAEMGKGV